MKTKTLNVNLGGKELKFKMGLLAILTYESITGKTFYGKTLYDFILLMYSAIISSNQAEKLSFGDFVETLDDNPEVMQEMMSYITEYYTAGHVAED